MFIVLEIQKSSDEPGGVATLIHAYADKNSAESAYHGVLAAAAISSVPVHSAVLLTDDGRWLRTESYTHVQQPAPQPEIEPEAE